MPKTRKNRNSRRKSGGVHPHPPGTQYDNKGNVIPPPRPRPLARQRGYDRSEQPDVFSGDESSISPASSYESSISPVGVFGDDLLARQQAELARQQTELARQREEVAALLGAPRRLDFNVGTGVLKRKSRKNKKRRKNRKSRKNKKTGRKAGCWPLGSCTSRPSKSQKPKGKKSTQTHRRKLSPPPRPRSKTQGKRGTRRFSPIRE